MLPVNPLARDLQRFLIEISGEDLRFRRCFYPGELFSQQNRNGIGLLARGATGHPDAHLIVAPLIPNNLWYDFFGQRLERVGIAKELRHSDQQVFEKVLCFLRIALQAFHVLFGRLEIEHLHAPLNSPHESALPVAAEIVPCFAPQHRNDPRQHLHHLGIQTSHSLFALQRSQVIGVFENARRHLLHRHDMVNQSGGNGLERHAIVVRGFRRLRQGHPAVLLHRFEPESSVSSDARQDDGNEVLAQLRGHGSKKGINWHPVGGTGSWPADLQHPFCRSQ